MLCSECGHNYSKVGIEGLLRQQASRDSWIKCPAHGESVSLAMSFTFLMLVLSLAMSFTFLMLGLSLVSSTKVSSSGVNSVY